MPIYQVEYSILIQGFDQVEANSSEEAESIVLNNLQEGDVESIESFKIQD